MKKKQKTFLAMALVFAFALAAAAQVAQKIDQTKLAQPPVTSRILKPCEGPDLVAGRPAISKQVISGKGFLNITAKVMNQGRWTSFPIPGRPRPSFS